MMIPTVWNEETYKEYIAYLKSIREEKYKEFHSKLCFTKYEILGIRLPYLRKIAKQIAKGEIDEFLELCTDTYYEEVMIYLLVVSMLKDSEVFDKIFLTAIDKIDNWALCDTFCNSIKGVRNNKDKYFELACELSLNSEEFISRVGLIMILSNFISDENVNKIFQVLNKIKSDKYYINMAQAWLVCELYIKYKDKTMEFLLNNKLNDFTHNKSISKIKESNRVTKEEKDCLNALKRK